jgi:hypothetical protein
MKSPFQLAESEEALSREVPMAILKKGGMTTAVPAALFGRLGMECLKPKSLAHLLDAMFQERTGGGYQFINFVGEPQMWR